MGYAPTLGGIKRLQEFFCLRGFPLPVFRIDIYRDGRLTSSGVFLPGNGQSMSIDDAIEKWGPLHKVSDVAIMDPKGTKGILFSDPTAYGSTGLSYLLDGYQVIPGIHTKKPHDKEFKKFAEEAWPIMLAISKWGKPEPSWIDKILFQCFPKQYINSVFADMPGK